MAAPGGFAKVYVSTEWAPDMPKIPDLPTIGPSDGAGWRLRPKGWREKGLDDRDPRGRASPSGRGRREARGEGVSLVAIEGTRERPHPNPLPEGEGTFTYVELHCHTCYSFREGASTPRQLVARAAALGYRALAITDRDGLYGAMEFAKTAENAGIRPIIGADVTLQGGYQLVLLAETREGYANLCQLLSNARLTEAVDDIRPEIPDPRISLADLALHTRGLIALSGDSHGEVPSLVAAGHLDRAGAVARRYADWFGPGNFFIELQQTLTYGDTQRNKRLVELARQLDLDVVATNDVWYHVRERHRLHDVLVATKHRTTLDGSHRLRHANSERYLKSHEEMAELFAELPGALENAAAIAERCQFDLTRDLGYEFPHAAVPPGETADTHLANVCWEALGRKYGPHPSPQPSPARGEGEVIPLPSQVRDWEERAIPLPSQWERLGEGSPSQGVRILEAEAGVALTSTLSHRSGRGGKHYAEAVKRLERELRLIKKHGLAGFFLAYYDLLRLAGRVAHELRGRDPDLPPDERPVGRGRGSSVSSVVCYLIGLSHIDPIANELFLGRFLNDELPSIPDIDLDYPRDIREEVLRRIWTEFDEGRAALVCAYSTYHTRSAIRDVGKALGLPPLEIDHLAKLSDAWGSVNMVEEMGRLPEYRAKIDAPLWRDLVDLCQQLNGLPRHVTQHVGGVVLSSSPLQEIVPLEPTRMAKRVMCQWDKDSVDDARMVKIDFLALGMLSLVDECLDTIEERHGKRPDLGRIPHDDPEIYDSICEGDTIGLFQIESRAQIATLAHTQPRNLDDLAVQVAIVRPGPIVGGAFHPYMEYRKALREGGENAPTITYIHPLLEPVLKDTLGVVLYQEQVVQVAMAIAGYSAGEADLLRRNLNRRHGEELAVEDWPEFVRRARLKGVPDDATKAAFRSILGFAAYGFPKSHAVAFGLLAYESAWLRYRYPAEYYAALLNNQPMGFYSPEVIAGDARRHGIELVRPDINLSGAGCVVEADRRVRLGLASVKGLGARLGSDPALGIAERIVAERAANGSFRTLHDCARRTGLKPAALESLVLAGAFDSMMLPSSDELVGESEMGGGRRDLLWQLGLISALPAPAEHRVARESVKMRQAALPLSIEQDMVELQPMTRWEGVAAEYEVLGLSPGRQAMALLRPSLKSFGDLKTSAQVSVLPEGSQVQFAGLVVCRQRPSTAKGIVFLSMEDEYGLANVVVYPHLLERERTVILTEPFLVVRGRIQRQGSVVHIVARTFERPDVQTDRLIRVSHDFH